MDTVLHILGNFSAWMEVHQQLAYVVLFFGAYIETLVGFSFVIPGEIFFVPGTLLAGAGVLNIWLVALVLYTGGALGDSSSYFIGVRSSSRVRSLFKKEHKVFSEKNYQRGEDFFKRHGPKAIFIARISGPFSWVTPFLAGTYGVPYKTFLKFNLPGVFVGIGEYLVAGYFFGSQYQTILLFMRNSLWVVLALLVLAVFAWWLLKKSPWARI